MPYNADSNWALNNLHGTTRKAYMRRLPTGKDIKDFFLREKNNNK